MSQNFNMPYIQSTLEEAADIAATRIAQNYALNQIVQNGSCTLEESENIYKIALKLLNEGAEDMIPENLELPDTAATEDADMDNSEADGELTTDDLEGIIASTADGQTFIFQDGILVPYSEEDNSSVMSVAGDEGNVDPDEGISESTTNVNADKEPEVLNESESMFSTPYSGVVKNILDNIK